MITIRLTRVGKKKDPRFRVIVVDASKKVKTGNYLEMVGSYDPRTDRVELKADRIKEWIQNGATVSDTVHNLLVSQKIIDAKKINVLPKKTVPKVEVAEAKPASAPDSAKATTGEDSSGEAKEDNVVAEVTATE